MRTYLHIHINHMYTYSLANNFIVSIQGEIAHANKKIKKVFWFGSTIDGPWLLFGYESNHGVLKQKLLQSQSRFSGFLGLCSAREKDDIALAVEYMDGSSETVQFDYLDSIWSKSDNVHNKKKAELEKEYQFIHKGDASLAETVIVLPTYQPDLGFLFEQVTSIREQAYDSWHCIIADDNSDDNFVEGIKRLVGEDEKFSVYQNDKNVGFYLNVERALTLVRTSAFSNVSYVALADQDDVWYDNKLDKLVSYLKDSTKAQLVFSDQKIVNENLQVLQDSFWVNRVLEFENIHKLLLKNCVTGAASVFRAELLEKALPFPESIGKMYHDHWLGLVARAQNGLAYLPQSLYAYRQHSLQDTGFGDLKSDLESTIMNYLIRAKEIHTTEYYVGSDQLSINILSHDVLRIAFMARIINTFCASNLRDDIEIFSLKEPQRLVEYLLKEIYDKQYDLKSTLGEEAYILSSSILSQLGNGEWQRIKVHS